MFASLVLGLFAQALSLPADQARPPLELPPPLSAPAPPPAPAPATGTDLGYFTAAELGRRCEDQNLASYCFAYVTAVHDTMRAYEVWLGEREFCVPADLSQGELRRAFLTYLGAYPAAGTGQAASVIVVALKETYPCL